MQKNIKADCAAYLEVSLKNGQVKTVNGKELTNDGVKHVIDYVGSEVGVKAEEVLTKIESTGKDNGNLTLKLFDGAVSAL